MDNYTGDNSDSKKQTGIGMNGDVKLLSFSFSTVGADTRESGVGSNALSDGRQEEGSRGRC